ncbi:MAG: hypothetical protein AB7V27_19515 [Candidatus Binatia bacterium]
MNQRILCEGNSFRILSEETPMTTRLIVDRAGLFTCEVEVNASVLRAALEHEQAENLLRCAMITALTALAQEGQWPERAMRALAHVMTEMRAQLHPLDS